MGINCSIFSAEDITKSNSMMKAVLVVAVTVLYLELASSLKTPEISAIINRLNHDADKMPRSSYEMLRRLTTPVHLRPVLIDYDNYISLVKDSCVTSEMRSFSKDALASFKTCAGNEESQAQQTADGKKLLDKVVNDLNAVDAMLDDVKNAADRARIVAEAEMNIVTGYYLDVTERMFTGLTPVSTCVLQAAKDVRVDSLRLLNSLQNCH